MEEEEGEKEPCSYLHGVEWFLEAVGSHAWVGFIFDVNELEGARGFVVSLKS